MNMKQLLMSVLLLGATASYTMAQAVDTTSTGSGMDDDSAMNMDTTDMSTPGSSSTMGTDDAVDTPDQGSTMETEDSDMTTPNSTMDTEDSDMSTPNSTMEDTEDSDMSTPNSSTMDTEDSDMSTDTPNSGAARSTTGTETPQ